MGWWKCDAKGQIDWDNRPTGHPGEDSLINAIPNRDSIEDYYNGDAPADAMYFPLAILKSWFINREPKPTTEQLTELFTQKKFDNVFRHIEWVKLVRLIDATWKRIDVIYKEAWDRPAYPEERTMICWFSFGGANSRGSYDWWRICGADNSHIKSFNEGNLPT